jgi:hypothetical protein
MSFRACGSGLPEEMDTNASSWCCSVFESVLLCHFGFEGLLGLGMTAATIVYGIVVVANMEHRPVFLGLRVNMPAIIGVKP